MNRSSSSHSCLSIATAARKLDISPRTLLRWWAAGKIQAPIYTRPSGRRVFDAAEFNSACASLCSVESPPPATRRRALQQALSIADKWERRCEAGKR